MIEWKEELLRKLGPERVLLDTASCQKLSKDYYWYSPILDEKLKDKCADGIVIVYSEADVEEILAFAYRYRLPVTVRGAGTGNYGQAVPLQGGIVLDLSKMNEILEFGDGYARVQCGVRLGALDKLARVQGQELRIYPSTHMTATVGGFVCGGSGGIGSITWGNLWDNNVLEAIVYTVEEKPRRLHVKYSELSEYIHNYGTTGVLTELVIALAPKQEWMQSVVAFASFEEALAFSEAIAADDRILKRLVSVMEWPIPSYLKPIAKYMEEDSAIVLLETVESAEELLTEWMLKMNGTRCYQIPAEMYRKTTSLSDFTWNHTTLWSLKYNSSITYLQADFSAEHYMEQVKQIKSHFGDEVLLHLEWIKAAGQLVPTALPLVSYTTEARMYEIISYFVQIGVIIYDPHTWLLDDGGRGELARMSMRKQSNDPLSLLNPGKLHWDGGQTGT